MNTRLILSLLGIVLIQSARADEPLGVGDPAPPLTLKEFIQGEPVKEFRKGTTYVIEFSGTQCTPCVRAMPILNDLQKKYPKVPFLSIYEENVNVVKKYVEANKEKIGIAVAADDNMKTDKAWMNASFMSGIPCVFIVNAESKIAWIGSPFDMAKPLQQVVDGSIDLEVEKLKIRLEQASRRVEASEHDHMAEFNKIVGNAMKSIHASNYGDAVAVLDEAIKRNPEWKFDYGHIKLIALADNPKTADQAISFAVQQYGELSAYRIANSRIFDSERCTHLCNIARTLLGACTKNPNRLFLMISEKCILQGMDRLQYIKPTNDHDHFSKYKTTLLLTSSRVELHTLRKEWQLSAQYQQAVVDLIKNDQYGHKVSGLSESDWKVRQEKMLTAAQEKLAELKKKAQIKE